MAQNLALLLLLSLLCASRLTAVPPAPCAASVWGAGGSSSSSGGKAALPPPPVDEPEDTNDDFCFRCGGGGDLLLCDRCDRSYHLYCVDPPLDVAPEGGRVVIFRSSLLHEVKASAKRKRRAITQWLFAPCEGWEPDE